MIVAYVDRPYFIWVHLEIMNIVHQSTDKNMSFQGILFLFVINLFAYSQYFGPSCRLVTENEISLEFNLSQN